MNQAILLDVDGVLTDWIGSCCELFGADPQEIMARWMPGHFYIEEALHIDSKTLWDKIDAAGEDYWANLPETPWAREFYAKCQEMAPTFFLTAPSRHPGSMAGKLRWLQAFTGHACKNYLVGPAKFLCANDCNVLVDDGDHNVADFHEAGGQAILFPRLWNSDHESWQKFGEDTFLHVLDMLREIVSISPPWPQQPIP